MDREEEEVPRTCCLALFLTYLNYLNMSNIISVSIIYLDRQMKMNMEVLTSVNFPVSNSGPFVCVFHGYITIC